MKWIALQETSLYEALRKPRNEQYYNGEVLEKEK